MTKTRLGLRLNGLVFRMKKQLLSAVGIRSPLISFYGGLLVKEHVS